MELINYVNNKGVSFDEKNAFIDRQIEFDQRFFQTGYASF